MSRYEVTQNGRTFWYGWDNPTQSYFIDGENPEPDPCKGCGNEGEWRWCEENNPGCPGLTYESTLSLYGPLAGVLLRSLGSFKEALGEVGFEPEAVLHAVRMCRADREISKHVSPRTELQMYFAAQVDKHAKEIR